jgi:hypothetical protein
MRSVNGPGILVTAINDDTVERVGGKAVVERQRLP